MFRNLFRIAGSIVPSTAFKVTRPILSKGLIGYKFTTAKVAPLMDRIKSQLDISNIDSILMQVQDLTHQQKQAALRLIFKKIHQQKLPALTLINLNYIKLIQAYPVLFIDVNMLHIRILTNYVEGLIHHTKEKDQQQEKLIQDTLKEISQSYHACFDMYEKIEKGELSIKYELFLGKNYANFYLAHSGRFVEKEERKQGLKRCKVILRNILSLNKMVIQEQKSILQKEQKSQTSQAKQIHQMRIHLLHQIDVFAQNVLTLSQNISQLQQFKISETDLSQGMSQTLNNIDAALDLYKLTKDLRFQSKHYLQLRMIRAQLNYKRQLNELDNDEVSKQKQKEFREQLCNQLDQVYVQAQLSLDMIADRKQQSNNIRQVALTIVSIRLQQLQRTHRLQIAQVEQQLKQESQTILNKIKHEMTKKAVQHQLQMYNQQVIAYLMQIYQEHQIRQAAEGIKQKQ